MISVLVPLDYSDATRNALNYIAAASHQIEINRVILLKSNYYSVYQNILHSAEYVYLHHANFEKERDEAFALLDELNKEFIQHLNGSTKVLNAVTELPMENAIAEIINTEKPDLLLLNSSPKKDDSNFIARNAIALSKASEIPVMIIPENTSYQPIESAVVPIDFKALFRLEAFREPIFAATNRKPYLHVLNIRTHKAEASDGQAQHVLHHILDGYDFSVHGMGNDDIVSGVMEFIRQNHIQMIVALPGKYNFFQSLTHRSVTRAIAANVDIPVLILNSR